VSLAKTDERIEMPFGKWTRVGPRNYVLDGGPKTFSRVGTILVVSGPMTSTIWDFLLRGMQQRDYSFPNNGLIQRVLPPASDVCLRAILQGSLSAD